MSEKISILSVLDQGIHQAEISRRSGVSIAGVAKLVKQARSGKKDVRVDIGPDGAMNLFEKQEPYRQVQPRT